LRLIRGEAVEGAANDFDPARQALVTAETAATLAPSLLSGAARNNAASADTATITNRTANTMTVAAETTSPAILVVSEMTFPGWQARVDGQAAELLCVNYLLRGVALPPGKHTVEIYYQPASLRLGLLVSSLAVLCWCLVFFWSSAKLGKTGSLIFGLILVTIFFPQQPKLSGRSKLYETLYRTPYYLPHTVGGKHEHC
jgi:hypothetical protein